MELKEDMYVRTEEGKIFKTDGDKLYLNNDKKILYRLLTRIPHDTANYKVIKASHNIIDLIEPMDLMYIDIWPDDCGGIVVPRVAETLNELEKWKERFAGGGCILKGVVTKKQLEKNMYWLGDK